MRLLGIILAASLVLAVLKVSLAIVLSVGLIMLIWLAVTRPTATASGLAVFVGYSWLMAHPIAGIVILCGLAALRLVEAGKAKP